MPTHDAVTTAAVSRVAGGGGKKEGKRGKETQDRLHSVRSAFCVLRAFGKRHTLYTHIPASRLPQLQLLKIGPDTKQTIAR